MTNREIVIEEIKQHIIDQKKFYLITVRSLYVGTYLDIIMIMKIPIQSNNYIKVNYSSNSTRKLGQR